MKTYNKVLTVGMTIATFVCFGFWQVRHIQVTFKQQQERYRTHDLATRAWVFLPIQTHTESAAETEPSQQTLTPKIWDYQAEEVRTDPDSEPHNLPELYEAEPDSEEHSLEENPNYFFWPRPEKKDAEETYFFFLIPKPQLLLYMYPEFFNPEAGWMT